LGVPLQGFYKKLIGKARTVQKCELSPVGTFVPCGEIMGCYTRSASATAAFVYLMTYG